MRSCILFFLSFLLLPAIVLADGSSKYDMAIAALNAKDCKKALPLIKEYKNENLNILNEYVDFLRSLNKQIELCEKEEAGRVKIEAMPFDAVGRTNLKAYQPPPSEIRFEVFKNKDVKG